MRSRFKLRWCQKLNYMDDCHRSFSHEWIFLCYDLSSRRLLRLIKCCPLLPWIWPHQLDSINLYNMAFCEPFRFYLFSLISHKLANSNLDLGYFHSFGNDRYSLKVPWAIHMFFGQTLSMLLILRLLIDFWAMANFGILSKSHPN